MTSSATLFYNRRYRLGRTLEGLGDALDLGSTPSVDRHNRRQRNRSGSGGNFSRRDRLNHDGCALSAFHNVSADLPSRQPRHQERDADLTQDNRSQSSLGNVGPPEYQISSQCRMGLSNSERLPGAVLLARERLLQRLRTVDLSNTRQRSGSLSRSSFNNIAQEDDSRFVVAGDWESEIAGSGEWLSIITPLTQKIEKPRGLTVEALYSLPIELFATRNESEECSICLERFSEGDQLIRLHCGHGYHFPCLNPWVQTCGDCPYCRRSITVDTASQQCK